MPGPPSCGHTSPAPKLADNDHAWKDVAEENVPAVPFRYALKFTRDRQEGALLSVGVTEGECVGVRAAVAPAVRLPLTDGAGVSVVYDAVGKDVFVPSLQCLKTPIFVKSADVLAKIQELVKLGIDPSSLM